MARKEHKQTPKVIGVVLYSDTDGIQLETTAWYDWLAGHTTFYLEAPEGTFTARREVRGGGSFWYAFRRVRRRLYKEYLGRSTDLTCERLKQVAHRLAERTQG
jgi:hypothetical protein